MSEYKPTIGLEIHAELKTQTKMFCDSKNDPDEKRPNVNICPICTAHPGTLPTINKKAVEHVLCVGYALGGTIADFTEFDRKNYFYPDIPKGYQISQYKYPLVSGGSLNGVTITRVHLEEDTARSTHDRDDSKTLIDFNRAGVPLMELVTEPAIKNAKEAGDFARELQLMLRYLGASEANMEKGEMRVEANVSVSKDGVMGTKVEIKNLNSFKVVEKAIEYEIARQVKEIERGGKVVQETRGWDENRQATFSQREKESSHDYRYFPDPDLPKLHLSHIPEFKNLKDTLPELPWQKRERYKKEYGIKAEDIEIYVRDIILGKFFETVANYLKPNQDGIKIASNHIITDVMNIIKYSSEDEDDKVVFPVFLLDLEKSPKAYAELIKMRIAHQLSSNNVTSVISKFLNGDTRELAQIVKEDNLIQESDEGELKKIIEKVIKENTHVAEEYKNGKEASLQFLVGQGMKGSKGSANPQLLQKLFREFLTK